MARPEAEFNQRILCADRTVSFLLPQSLLSQSTPSPSYSFKYDPITIACSPLIMLKWSQRILPIFFSSEATSNFLPIPGLILSFIIFFHSHLYILDSSIVVILAWWLLITQDSDPSSMAIVPTIFLASITFRSHIVYFKRNFHFDHSSILWATSSSTPPLWVIDPKKQK